MEKIIHLTDLSNLPLSTGQERLWIIAHQDKEDSSHNIQLAYHIEGTINIEIFKESMRLLFERQHTLFSVFKHIDRIPFISIIRRPVIVEIIDYSGLEYAREQIFSFAGQQSRIPFDIENGPLYRIHLLKETEESYFFCFTIHHLIFDGFSRRLFVDELSLIYNNLLNGISTSVEPLKYHSYDFAFFEKEDISADKEKEYLEYWKDALKDFPLDPKIPLDFPRRNNPSKLGRKEIIQIPKELSDKIRLFSRDSDTSVFKTLLSMLSLFLYKFTGVNDICIGIPVSTRRTSPSSFKIFGFFVNLAPARLLINEWSSFKEHVTYSSEASTIAIQNSKYPLEKIIALNPERIPGVNPFFHIGFSWINNFTGPLDLGGVKGKKITIPDGVSSLDITFYMWEEGDYIEGEIEYNCDIFTRETILRLKENFLTLLDNLLEKPDSPVISLSMISDKEKEIIDGFNNTSSDYPKEKTIIQLFEEQASLYPDKKAVVFKDTFLTYRQLNEKSNQLARILRNLKVKANDPVGLLAERSVNMIAGMFGILKAGAGYVPLEPEYPKQRKDFIISDSGCKVVVAQDKYIAGIEAEIKLSLDSPESYHNEKTNIERINASSDLAYIIYTSGTTGTPKGTPIPQKGVVRLVRNTNYIEFKPEDNVLQTASVVFDASTEEIFGALLNGSTLFIIDKETLLDPDELKEVLTKNSITIADFSSALFAQIAESHPDVFQSLKYLILGGQVLSAFHANKVRKNCPGLSLINTYGPTENSCDSTYYIIDRDFDNNIPIGKPISNSTAYIFDKSMNYQPIGIIGELYVGGDGLSKGYLNKDDLNKICFVDHSYYPGERLYKTGDLARWLPDGNIEFHGRIDNQVKIRGYRIELNEIETVISEVQGITDAIVKPIVITENDIRLVAFLKVPVGTSVDFNKVTDHIRSKLPSYMVPSAYKTVNAFPITINGKIDTKALNIDLSKTAEEKKIVIKDLTLTQQKLIRIWQELIKTNSIGINDNFFDVGGSSLLAIWAVDRIEKEFNIKLSLRVFFDSPRIQSLAEHIDFRLIPKKTYSAAEPRQVKVSDIIISGEI